jgi:hypothetical protein
MISRGFPILPADGTIPTLESVARHHGVAVILVHPNITGAKLAFEGRLVDAWKVRAWARHRGHAAGRQRVAAARMSVRRLPGPILPR